MVFDVRSCAASIILLQFRAFFVNPIGISICSLLYQTDFKVDSSLSLGTFLVTIDCHCDVTSCMNVFDNIGS